LTHAGTVTDQSKGNYSRRQSRRRLWFLVHSWLGVGASLVMLVIILTGVLATLGYELEWLLDPDLRVTPKEQAASYADMLSAVKQVYPEGVVQSIWGPKEPYLPAQAQVIAADESWRKVYVDPYTSEVLADKGIMTLQTFLRNLHNQLFLPRHGILLVGSFGLILLASTMTGLIVYKKFWRGLFKLRLGKGTRIFCGDLHRLTGVWSLWFLLLMSLTGLWYGVEVIIDGSGSDLVYPEYPTVSEARLNVLESSPAERAPLSEVIATAKAQIPDLEVTTVRLPTAPSQAVVVHGTSGHTLVRGRANAVFIDPYDASPIATWRLSEAGLSKRWVHTVDPLHFGNFAGLVSKLIWVVFGLMILAQIVTGFWMWRRRKRR